MLYVKVRMKLITIAILLLLFVSACESSQSSTDPASLIQAYFEALSAGDIEEAQVFVGDDATFDILGDVLIGKEQIRDYNQKAVTDKPSYELSNIQVDGNKVTYTNRVTIGSEIFTLTSEAVVQEGKIVSIIDR